MRLPHLSHLLSSSVMSLISLSMISGPPGGCNPSGQPGGPPAGGSAIPGRGAGGSGGSAVSVGGAGGSGGGLESPAERFRRLYADYEAKVEPAARAYELAWWEAALSGSKEAFARSAELELQLRKLHADQQVYTELSRLRQAGPLEDALLQRSLDVLYLRFKENQLEPARLKALVDGANALEQTFNTFRATVDGKTVTANEIRKVLAESNDGEQRRKVWEASKAVGPLVAEPLRKLILERNEAARTLGYRNYYEMRLDLGEQQPEQIAAIFEGLDRETASPFAAMKSGLDQRLARRFGVSVEQLRPWHYSDVFFQESPGVEGLDLDAAFTALDPKELNVRFFNGIGLPVVSEILARSDLYERPGKVEHAFCTHIDRRGDVRVLCNLKNDERWTGTLLHELGHGVYDAHIDLSLPWLLRQPSHSFTTEGVAELFGTLTRNPEWLAEFAQLPAQTREKLAALAREEDRQDKLIFARWSLVLVGFERALYRDPGADLNKVWWDLVARYQGLTPPEKLDGRADWAAKIHVVTVPAYYHNYMLGRMFAAQLKQKLAQLAPQAVVDGRLRLASQPGIGNYLIEEIFRPGLRYRWDEHVRRATGEPLSAGAFVASLR